MLHAGVLKKFGLYGLIRIALPLFPEAIADLNGLTDPWITPLTELRIPAAPPRAGEPTGLLA
jgi:NADH-quinone oxidoreductase subunit M